MASAVAAQPTRGSRPSMVVPLLLALVLVSGFGLRLVRISTVPLVYASGRQFHAGLVARNYELGGDSSSADPDQRVASAGRAPLIEPPILEVAVAGIWRATGTDSLSVGGVLSSLVWTLGGFWMYALGRRLVSRLGGLVAAALFMFSPLVLLASRTFMPDPLMVVAIVGATLALVIDHERHDRTSWAWAAGASAAALFVKAVAGFLVLPVMGALAVRRDGWRGLVSKRTLALGGLAVVPALAWQVYGTWIQDFLAVQSGGRILPHLLTRSGFWSAWWNQATLMAGVATLLVAIGGLLVARDLARWVIGALVAGYLLFGLVFDYNYATHSYYHLPLMVPVALGVAAAVDRAVTAARTLRSPVAFGLVALLVVVLVYDVVAGAVPLVEPSAGQQLAVVTSTAAAVGGATGHSTHVILLSPADGDQLRFYGRVAGPEWPGATDLAYLDLQGAPGQAVADRFTTMSGSLGGADFFAVTALDELAAQPDLESFLDGRYSRVTDCGGTCVVWDLRSGKMGG